MSKIEWTERTWNPIVGCSIVSPGCTNCYAMKMADRLARISCSERLAGRKGMPHYAGTTKIVNGNAVWTGMLNIAPDHILTEPLRRKKPTMYFVNSMSDLFHESVSDDWIDRVFAVMALCPQHTFQVLTKRSARMRAYLSMARAHPVGLAAMDQTFRYLYDNPHSNVGSGVILQGDICHLKVWPLPNVWLGVSAEDQKRADERVPDLLATPAAIRFVSAEPLLGPIDFDAVKVTAAPGFFGSALRWHHRGHCHEQDGVAYPTLNWIIVGGESGHGARPMHPDWARGIREQCAGARVAFFFKQWGEWIGGEVYSFNKSDGTTQGGLTRCADGLTHGGKPTHWWSGDAFGGVISVKISKNAAGRLLDGREHNDMPRLATNSSEAA